MSVSKAVKRFRPKKTGKGFWDNLGLPGRGQRLFTELHEGFRYQIYDRIASQAGIEKQQLARAVLISPATLSRRAKDGRFKPEESDRLFRFAEILKAAIELFEGNQESAQRWLAKPNKGLGGKAPLEMLGTSTEAEAVEDLIGRLEHGVIV